MTCILFEKVIGPEDLLVTADTDREAPIEVGVVDGVTTIMTIPEARKVRKALKKAIKVAEAYHGGRA